MSSLRSGLNLFQFPVGRYVRALTRETGHGLNTHRSNRAKNGKHLPLSFPHLLTLMGKDYIMGKIFAVAIQFHSLTTDVKENGIPMSLIKKFGVNH